MWTAVWWSVKVEIVFGKAFEECNTAVASRGGGLRA